jgi:hypothetical protein
VDKNTALELIKLGDLWREDPAMFVRDAFGAEPVEWQIECMRRVHKHNKVAIKSGHGVGKTTTMSWLIIWWLITRSPAKIAVTAPSGHQLEDVLWAEIGTWLRKMRPELRDMFELRKDKLVVVGREEDCFAVARTARKEKPEAFQGFHSQNMLFIVDEASGVDDIIFEVGSGAMSTRGAKTIMVGNPNRLSGYFYNAFHKMRKIWSTMTVSCLDSPIATPEYAEEQALAYGIDSNIYKIRVLGDFPDGEDNTVMKLSVV